MTASPTHLDTPVSRFNSRLLTALDIPALLQLESRQWDEDQAADAQSLRERMAAYPELCVGTFCARTGEALSSLFMRPVEREKILNVKSWDECASNLDAAAISTSRSLFGISMTSVDPDALRAMEAFVWPQILRLGWREIYLGSPMPGLRRALSESATLSPHDYAHAKRRGLPRDMQLRYYHQKGLPNIVAVLPGYFPYPDSLDYGALLRGDLADIAARTCDVSSVTAAERNAADESVEEGVLA